MGCFVAGLEASADWSDLGGTATNPFASAAVLPNTTYETKLRWLATVTPRFGYAVSNWLFYMKGGLAAGSVDSTLASSATAAGPTQFLGNQDHIGWTMGTGIEYLFCKNWIIGLEYNYYDLGTQRYGGEAAPTTTFPVDYTVHPSFNTVLARMSYKFW
jgi:outer membrane immunogenic protein